MPQPTPSAILAHILAGSRVARDIGVRVIDCAPGQVRLGMKVTAALLNGVNTCHGGYLFTLGDCAGAFACLTHNQRAVTQSAQIVYLEPAHEGQELVAEGTEVARRRRTGVYSVRILQDARVVATLSVVMAIREEPVLAD